MVELLGTMFKYRFLRIATDVHPNTFVSSSSLIVVIYMRLHKCNSQEFKERHIPIVLSKDKDLKGGTKNYISLPTEFPDVVAGQL